jgi:hypothetical protein
VLAVRAAQMDATVQPMNLLSSAAVNEKETEGQVTTFLIAEMVEDSAGHGTASRGV